MAIGSLSIPVFDSRFFFLILARQAHLVSDEAHILHVSGLNKTDVYVSLQRSILEMAHVREDETVAHDRNDNHSPPDEQDEKKHAQFPSQSFNARYMPVSGASFLNDVNGGATPMLVKNACLFALSIDGLALELALQYHSHDFLSLFSACDTIISYRSTPLQKSLVVRCMKKNFNLTTLAIGDGANDV